MIVETETREDWFERRREFVTATDIARLANGGPATWAAVRAEKLTGERAFHGNAYTEWGQEREPVLMSLLSFLYDVDPNDQVYVLDGTRWAATPDGVSALRTAEVKTSVKPFGDTPDELRQVKPGYYDQVQWAMLATARAECAFGWELNDSFTPGPGATFLIPRDEDRIGELVKVGDEFLTYLAEGEQPGEWDALLADYAEAQAEEAAVAARKTEITDRIRERAGGEDLAVRSPIGSISLAFPKPRRTFDVKRFQAEQADLYSEYMTETAPSKKTLRVSVKGKQ